jgi:hypothetical protein
MPRTVSEADRKQAYGVSLTRRQREKFVQIGGSAWLQARLDDLIEGDASTRRLRAANNIPTTRKARTA